MRVRVQYTAQLKAALDLAEEWVTLPGGATVKDVIAELTIRHADAFHQFVVSSEGVLLPSILICLGDQQSDRELSAPLRDGDTVTLLSAISGG